MNVTYRTRNRQLAAASNEQQLVWSGRSFVACTKVHFFQSYLPSPFFLVEKHLPIDQAQWHLSNRHILKCLSFQSVAFERTWWRLFWAYLTKVILNILDEGYSEHTWWRLFWAYLMKVILNIPDEGYSEHTWWRLFQKLIAHTKFDIYVLIK